MNNRSFWGALAVTLLAVTVVAAVGLGAYRAGLAQGIAQGAQAIATAPAGTPLVYMPPRPWGFGFFPFFPIFPLFFVFFLFFVVRGLMWRGPRRGGWGHWHDGVPPAFEEWHRRAHAGQPGPTSTPGSTT